MNEPDPTEDSEADAAEQPRRYPSTLGGMFYLLLLATSVLGLGIVASGAWREGIRLVGIALIVAAGIRLVLPEAHAGMLAVRPKPLDAAMLAGAGAVLLFLAGSIPDQPGL